MGTTPGLSLKTWEESPAEPFLRTQINDNMQKIDVGIAGTNNKSTRETKNLLVGTDTRSVSVTRSSGQISSITIKDPSDNSTVASVAVNRVGGQVSSIEKTVGVRVVTTTVARTDGLVTGITKAVV